MFRFAHSHDNRHNLPAFGYGGTNWTDGNWDKHYIDNEEVRSFPGGSEPGQKRFNHRPDKDPDPITRKGRQVSLLCLPYETCIAP